MAWIGGFREWHDRRLGRWVSWMVWSAIGSVGFMDGVIGDCMGRWVSWMAWVSGSAMAWSAIAGLDRRWRGLCRYQMVGLMVVWVCVVVGGWLFSGSGKVDCAVCVDVVGWLFFGSGCGLWRLWCFFCSSMYYFIRVNILFYCNRYIILLCRKLK